MKKRFYHSCDQCTFLGNHKEYDLYHCYGSFGGSLLARYGDEPHEYLSGNVDSYLQGKHFDYMKFTEGQALFKAVVQVVKNNLDKNCGPRESKLRHPLFYFDPVDK